MNQSEFATISQVADQFNLSSRTIRRYIAAGRLTAYRVGPKLIRLNSDEVARVLTGQQIQHS